MSSEGASWLQKILRKTLDEQPCVVIHKEWRQNILAQVVLNRPARPPSQLTGGNYGFLLCIPEGALKTDLRDFFCLSLLSC